MGGPNLGSRFLCEGGGGDGGSDHAGKECFVVVRLFPSRLTCVLGQIAATVYIMVA